MAKKQQSIYEIKVKGLNDIKALNKHILELNGKYDDLKKTTEDTEDSLKDVGNAAKDTGNFSKKMGKAFVAATVAVQVFTKAARTLSNTIKHAKDTFKGFEFSMAKVKAISGANAEEFKKLNNSAKELGRTTFFTAQNVAELQLSLSKLGFRTDEILDSQEAILKLSTAMGQDLGRTATVVAASIRGFGEDTDQTARFADVMASAFANSALDLEKFQTSMTKVSAIAATAGFSFEETTGLLGLLTDRGIEASIAGTSLRNILLALQDPTSNLSERLGRTVHSGKDLIIALKELDASGINVAGVMGIVEKRQVQAMESFIRSATALEDLNKILITASGSAEDMSEIMEDTLQGAILKAKSAYEGFILTVLDGNGLMQKSVERIAQFISNISDMLSTPEQLAIREIAKATKEAKDAFADNEKFISTLSEKGQQLRKKSLQQFLEQQQDEMIKTRNNIIKTMGITGEGEGRTFDVAKTANLTDEQIAFRLKRLDVMNAAIDEMDNVIDAQIDRQKEAKKKFEQDEKDAAAADEARRKRAEEERIKAIENHEFLKNLEAPEGDAVKSRAVQMEQFITDEKLRLQKDYVDGKIQTEAELNAAILKMQLERYNAELKLLERSSTIHNETSQKKIELEAQVKASGEQTQEAKNKATQDEIQNIILHSETAKDAFSQLISMRINEILLNAMNSIFSDSSIPFIAQVGLAIGLKSLVTPLINNILGGDGGGETSSAESSKVGNQFANGGLTKGGMFQGNSHANGGVKFRVGGRIHEAEGGEAIINKKSTSMFRPMLSAINSYNGNGVKFADGGLLNSGEKFAMGGELRSAQQLVSGGIGSSKVVIVESDMTDVQNRISAIESQATF